LGALHYSGIPGHLTDGAAVAAAREIAENKFSSVIERALTLRGGLEPRPDRLRERWRQIKLQVQAGI
jgi:hypothetical protein